MADGSVYFGDFPQIDSSTINNNFGSRNDRPTTYVNNAMKPAAPGYYTDHFMHISGNTCVSQSNYDSALNDMNVTTATAQVSPHDLSHIGSSQVVLQPSTTQSDIEHNKELDDPYGRNLEQNSLSLAKPIPMKRLSEKRLAQTRACFSAPSDVLESNFASTSPALARALIAVQQTQKRQRSEKKPIPDEHRDNKYYERRHRNNHAAKRSRDARKAREDEIAIRASFLEKENAILRAQVSTLREEANSLRQLLLQRRSRHI